MRLALPIDDRVWQQLDVPLDDGVVELPTDEALGVVDRAFRVGGRLVLGGLADEPLAAVGKGDPGRGDPVALVVGDYLDVAVPVDADARVGGAEVDTDYGAGVAAGLALRGRSGSGTWHRQEQCGD